MLKRRFRFQRTTIITVGLIAFLAGLGLARTRYAISANWVGFSLLFVLLTVSKKRFPAILGVILLGLSLGWWRGSVYLARLEPYKELQNQKVVVRVTAESDGVYDKSQLSFDSGSIQVVKPVIQDIPGRMSIKGFGEAAVYRGDVVQAEGKLYLTRGSKQASISYGEIKVLGRSSSVVDRLRLRFAAGMQNALPEPLASFGLGLLIGQKSTLPAEVSRDLAIVGLTHIIAVSGYNLTIIIRAARRMFGKRSKYQALVLSLLLISSFLLVTGFSASIVRAAIVSGLSLIAWYYGRTFRPILLITLAAALTAGWYPLFLWSDIGWYLSFLAFYGVLVLAPMIMQRFSRRKEPNGLNMIITESLCAQLMTAPFILFIFKQVSLIGLLSNVLIVPLVPLAMLLSLFAGMAGMIWPVLAGLIGWPAKMLLTYMIDLTHIMARWPHALLGRSLQLTPMLFLYGALILVSFVLWRKTPKTVKITDIEIEE